ncbi:hypothetical protein DL766_009186 [Monosporascus sp. MC13-8B]|uniref:Major facilitator superfamily (MFS) profile domain-containing protein n=1 Tax=Monosporascus cannonballus TaxID=155416 RepID=A0ABY0H8B6_9PEZI|nr:hypothetical protein DL763_008884 [Monosporascus cannonballus]RYO84252.1 hypothetical protein DL762_005759 [Monosporascus cannonballus]RYP16232.1 hypothetical protein DL766_009186 [Monosporascus sp. MC13-8B]
MERIQASYEGDVENDQSKQEVLRSGEQVRWRDLPNKDQLFIIALCRLSAPLSNVFLLPYVFYLVRSALSPSEDGTPDDDAGRIAQYSGLLVAAFPLAQFTLSLSWGRLSDRYGRRLSIIGGLGISILANIGFGLSRSIGALLFWRVLAGFGNANVGLMRTATAETVKERKYHTKAFLLMPLVFKPGMVVTFALSGYLAEPVKNLPWLFGPDGVWNTTGNPEGVEWTLQRPYALPAFMTALILGIPWILAALGLRETLPGRESYSDVGLRAGATLVRFIKRFSPSYKQHGYMVVGAEVDTSSEGAEPCDGKLEPAATIKEKQDQIPFRKVWTRKVVCSLVSFGLLPLHNSAFMHIFPVYLSSPQADNTEATLFAFTGGLGLGSASVGLWLSVFGICGILLQLFIYPRLQARLGTRGVFRIALFVFPITYAAAPYLSLIGDGSVVRWLILGFVACSQIMARTIAIPSTVILLTEAAPSKKVLGTIHSGGHMLASLARALGPALGGYVFAVGVQHGIVGLVWWFYLFIVAVCALAWSYFMDTDDVQ